MYFVYVLKSNKNGRFYTGSTNDINRRLVQHNQGRSKYTRTGKPFVLLRTEEYKTRSEAMNREIYLKTGKGREELMGLLNLEN